MTKKQFEALMLILRRIESDIHRLIHAVMSKGNVTANRWEEEHPDEIDPNHP